MDGEVCRRRPRQVQDVREETGGDPADERGAARPGLGHDRYLQRSEDRSLDLQEGRVPRPPTHDDKALGRAGDHLDRGQQAGGLALDA